MSDASASILLPVSEAAKRLAISRSKLYQMVEKREIAHFRVGAKILFSEEQLCEYLQGCEVRAGQARPDTPFTHVRLPSSRPP